MAVITPFFDVVAGVAILAGRSSLLDTGVFKTANTNFTIRHILALGFIGVGVWNLWKIERAQDKLKKSLGAEIWAEAVDWFDEQGSDNEGFPYGISYMAGPERGEIEWFSDEEERDMVLETYIGEMEGELYTTDPETGMVVPMNAESYYGLGAEKNVMDDVLNLQNMAEKYLPESIRDDAEAIKYSLQYIDNDKLLELDDLPKLNKVQELAGEVVLWTVEMLEAYEEGELNLGAESFGAEPMFVESDSLMVELMGFDGSYRTDGEVKMGYTTAAELGFEPKELKPVMWVWDDIEGYGAFMPTDKIRFI